MPALPDLAAIGGLFVFKVHPLELVLRGSVMYWLLFLLLRFVLRRDASALGVADLLLVVLIADASQNAMAGGHDTLAEGAMLVLTLVGWNWLFDWAAYRWKAVRRFVEPPALVLVRRGRIVGRNLRSENLTVAELLAGLRGHGIDKLDDVKIARLEPDGGISVIRRDGAECDSGATKGPLR
jgi:uncharacterized membrane protein YcaP (DUF421 family)